MKYSLAFVVACSLVAMTLAPTVVRAAETDGFIYGAISTRSGNSYTGIIRWGSEESFWDDIFHSAKEELPYAHYAEKDERSSDRGDEEWWETFGRKMKVVWDRNSESRVFSTRFGEIEEIRVDGRNSAELTMRSGEKIAVAGYANDVGETLVVYDRSLGKVEVPWKKIETIRFAETPADVQPPGRRLYGVAKTDAGEFTGYIQWDSQECLDVDELDGDNDDGRMSIAMGKIKSIERRSKRSSTVTLADGRELVLDGTNDVDSSIRGILVEDPRFGRVKIPWSAFDRVELRTDKGTGRGYDEYGKSGQLRAIVTSKDGKELKGRLIFDVDEAAAWEMLNGSAFDIEYSIPFSLVTSIVPRGSSSAQVTLVGGEALRLEDSQDVSDHNDGMVIIDNEDEEHYVPWRDVKEIQILH